MKKLAFSFFLSLLALSGRGQGFPASALQWPLPAGGITTSTGAEYSYQTTAHSSNGIVGDRTWAVLDMNGDHRPDLVLMAEPIATRFDDAFGTGTNRFWKVFLNSGSGYATTATTWALPAGGHIASGSGHFSSFNNLSYAGSTSYYTGDQTWTVKDMNGDARPDLVVLTEGDGSYGDVFGTGTGLGRYWKVYLNTGTGFAATATTWALPAGGYASSQHFFSFFALASDLTGSGIQSWSVLDLNGDRRPDLVVLTDNDAVPGPNASAGRYWKAYLNTGTGFATTATNWTLPAGGYVFVSGGIGGGTTYYHSFDALTRTTTSYAGDQTWAVLDMDGDARPDLAVLTEKNSTYSEPYGTGTTGRYWKVYLSSGTGFATTATTWALPAGGSIDASNGHRYSFDALAGSGYNNTGDQAWTTRDMNGDNRPDIVVLREGTGTSSSVFGTGTARYWNVYLNSSSGFASAATAWGLPAGGYVRYGASESFTDMRYTGNTNSGNLGCQGWEVLDLDGDNKQDLVVLTEGDGNFGNNVFGTGTSRYWRAYLGSGRVTAVAGSAASPTPVVTAYPNPATDHLLLQSSAALLGQPYTIVDNLGRVVLDGKITAVLQSIRTDLLAEGVYIVSVGSQLRYSLRIAKQ